MNVIWITLLFWRGNPGFKGAEPHRVLVSCRMKPMNAVS